MPSALDRREFLTASASVAAGLSLAVSSAGAQTTGGRRGGGTQTAATPAAPPTFKTRLHKALIARPTEEDLTRMKAAGFEYLAVGRSLAPPDAEPA